MNDKLGMKESLGRITAAVTEFMNGGYEDDPEQVLDVVRKELDQHLGPLTAEKVQRRIDRIRAHLDRHDHEAASSEQLSLYVDTLRHCASEGCALAKKVLVLEDLGIQQWG